MKELISTMEWTVGFSLQHINAQGILEYAAFLLCFRGGVLLMFWRSEPPVVMSLVVVQFFRSHDKFSRGKRQSLPACHHSPHTMRVPCLVCARLIGCATGYRKSTRYACRSGGGDFCLGRVGYQTANPGTMFVPNHQSLAYFGNMGS